MATSAAPSLLVSERFVSLQGEGISQGEPAAFLRLGRCNLTCSFCDTPYTWDFENYSFDQELTTVALGELVAWAVAESPGRLIVTGGEPLIQQKELARFFSELDRARDERRLRREFIEIETNGTVLPLPLLTRRVNQWNVSPKLKNSAQPTERAIRPAALAHFASLDHAYFKFVVRDEADTSEAMALVHTSQMRADRVLLMPEARDARELSERGPKVAELALRARVRYSGRMHLELFGGGRGV